MRHTGIRLLADVAVRITLDLGFSSAPAPLTKRSRGMTPGRVLDAIEEPVLERLLMARARREPRCGPENGVHAGDSRLRSTLAVVEPEIKKRAAPNRKHGHVFLPVVVYLDRTREVVAGNVRAGNAGADTARAMWNCWLPPWPGCPCHQVRGIGAGF